LNIEINNFLKGGIIMADKKTIQQIGNESLIVVKGPEPAPVPTPPPRK
jgi:hypothetical protein